ncbi:DivIVA domain-containing protein, partial [Micromonospora sp. KC207]|uniref:DivIVA domain-containing protein n=1 Tax=Micromonospora sp. KC207 TaxID=2530377 RepID=UPI001050BB63
MASQGQRFRRKALRRGYKVDEVDAFLDRVEATLDGRPVGAPVASQEVHDVVFRVRFNGYDEWQVDLHLDRVERQLAELEERGGSPGRGTDHRMADRLGPPDRMGPPMRDERGPVPMRDERGPLPMRDDRGPAPMMPQAMPPRPMPAQAGPPADRYGRYDEPTGGFSSGYDAPRGGYDSPRGPGGSMGPGGPVGPGQGMGHGGPPPRGLPPGPGGYGPDEQRFDGFEAGRHGRADMTAEIRMPERDLRELRGRGPAGPPPMPPQPVGGPPPMAGPPVGPPAGGPPIGGPPAGGPPMAGPPGSDLYRVDQIRRSFQVRRFGSGYDPDQVDRLFEGILDGMSGRGPMPVNPKDLDTLRFGLVPGGYFEAEVDAALKGVQDI